jgi:hypothetical protein
MKAAGAGDFHGGTKRLSNEMPRRPVVGRIPMHGRLSVYGSDVYFVTSRR